METLFEYICMSEVVQKQITIQPEFFFWSDQVKYFQRITSFHFGLPCWTPQETSRPPLPQRKWCLFTPMYASY